MIEFKPKYEDRYKEVLGDEYPQFKEAIIRPLKASIRINTLKVDCRELIERFTKDYKWGLNQVPFYKNGYKFETKKPIVLGNTLEHFLGYFYIQEVASMIPPIVLNPQPEETILDMAAAPGSKTTQMAQMMNNKGVIVANEKTIKRITSLRMNLQRCGARNVVTTLMDGKRFKRIDSLQFDKILLDAPCTGTGAVMKSIYTLKTWSVKASEILSGIQKQLMQAAFHVLKDGGTLVYSTCSLEPEEDEEIVDYAIKKLGMQCEKFSLKNFKMRPGMKSWQNKEYVKGTENSNKIFPQDNDTEGFFVARLRKIK
ncbi:MAG TPA: RsmB/NOP family class I SAM-dependent RNA methyltransferase [Candidatus Woesearchaeota archaeon]|nr:RsmB/NOP family class I SAM-dependent RNA methyltransferase [Candidatus Woesearchaeota archaeon]